jgi:signal transduction histidine kinase
VPDVGLGIVKLRTISAVDLALAAGVAAIGQVEVWTTSVAGSQTQRAAWMLLATLPIALRRLAPVSAAWIFMVGMVGEGVSMDATNSLAQLIAALMLSYAASPGSRGVNDVVFDVVGVTAAWALGAAARSRQLRAEKAEQRVAEAERERDIAERAAMAAERVRIARELHDIVAHALGVIAVQAGAAEAVLDSDRARARETIAAIRREARESVTEMRRVLGLLRDADGEGREPQPSLADVESLADRFRASGFDVTLTVEGERRRLAPGVELSAFRIVQEALTNVTRHSDAERAHVRLRFAPRMLEIEVIDEGRPRPGAAASGFGLIGLRERVALLAGTLQAGPRAEGGYRLRADLPLGEPQA